jgi:hypothetical protein
MAKHPPHILELARKGAQHRYEELKAELATLVKHFPHLGSAVSPAIDSSSEPLAVIAPNRKRRKMSKAARKKISDAQKARWAKQKAGKKG